MRRPVRALRRARRLGLAALVGARDGVAQARRPRQRPDGRRVVVGTDGQVHRLGPLPKPTVPQCPPGWTVGPPDFVIVGAEKSGTSRWLRLLRAHPDVHVATGGREIHFWDAFHTRWPGPEDVERYHRMFPRPPGTKAGEKTPQYMSLWWAPSMLAAAAPDAAIIVMLRDPVERYISGRTQHDKYRPLDGDAQALAAFRRRVVQESMHRGNYAVQLGWLRQAYPAERILVLQHEACIVDAQAQFDRTTDHIGLARYAVPPELFEEPVNKAWLEPVPIEPERRALLRDLYRPEVMRIKQLVPDLDLSLWRNYAELAERSPSGEAAAVS
jgi:hypothetical protein